MRRKELCCDRAFNVTTLRDVLSPGSVANDTNWAHVLYIYEDHLSTRLMFFWFNSIWLNIYLMFICMSKFTLQMSWEALQPTLRASTSNRAPSSEMSSQSDSFFCFNTINLQGFKLGSTASQHHTSLDHWQQLDVIYTDFSSDFDKINHSILIEEFWF